MTYVASPFERPPLEQVLPAIAMRDWGNASFEGWDTGIADAVAHLKSANATIAEFVVDPSEPLTTLMVFELTQAANSVQRALLALDIFSHIAGLPADRQSLTKDQPAQHGVQFLALGPKQLPRSLPKSSAGAEDGPRIETSRGILRKNVLDEKVCDPK